MKAQSRKATWLLLAVALVLSLIAAACGGAAPTPAPPTKAPVAPAPAAPAAPAPAATAAPAPAAAPVTLKFTSPLPPPPYSAAVIAEEWGKEVEKRTNGQVKFQFFHGGTLSKPQEELDAIQKGVAESGFVTLPYYPSKLPLGNFSYAVPFGPDKATVMLEAATKLYDAVPELKAEIERNNMKIIFLRVIGNYDIVSKSPIRTLDDLKGKKLASIGDYHPKIVQAGGGTPVAMPVAERYQALQTGVVEGSVLPLDLSVNSRFHEVAKNAIQVGLGAAYSTAITINQDVWNKISPANQKIILEVGAEAGKNLAGRTDKMIEDAIVTIKASGGTIIDFPAPEKAKWAEKLPDFPAEWAKDMNGKGLPGTKVMETYFDIAAKAGFKQVRPWGTK